MLYPDGPQPRDYSRTILVRLNVPDKRLLIPQHRSIVVVFEGDEHIPIDERAAENAVGAPPLQSVPLPVGGVAFGWPEALTVSSRRQGPNRNRIEAADGYLWEPGATTDGFERVRAAIAQLVECATEHKAVSVGINAIALALSVLTPDHASPLDELIDRDAMNGFLGRKSGKPTEMRFQFPMRPGTVNLVVQEAQLPDLRLMSGTVLNVNYSLDVSEDLGATDLVSKKTTDRVQKLVADLAKRMERLGQ